MGLYLAKRYSFLLFHSLAEMFSIAVACGIFLMAWNARRFLNNNALLFLGIASLFVAALDLVHTLGYPGMTVFAGSDTNLSAQLWIAYRYTMSLSFLIAPFFVNRKIIPGLLMAGYGVVTALLLALIFYWRVFAVCFLEDEHRLTWFKIISEYRISLIFAVALGLFVLKRENFDKRALELLVPAILASIVSEYAFTLYDDPYGLANRVGHYFKLQDSRGNRLGYRPKNLNRDT